MYQLDFTKKAKEDIEALVKSGDKSAIKKLYVLLDELMEHPETGTGQPEELKHGLSGRWSRRINQKNRLVYKIEKSIITVIVLQAKGHYEDE